MEESELHELFTNACSYVRSHSGTLRSDDLLYFYARFKQVKCCCVLIGVETHKICMFIISTKIL